jgi:hypothetical protein
MGDFMKTTILLALAVSSTMAFAEHVLYCGGLNVEGTFLKILPDHNKMCISGGPWGPGYCSAASTSLDISESRTGSLNIGGKDFSFREFVGKSGSITQLVRVFNDASNPSGADVTVHRADLAGVYLLLNLGVPSAEAKDGEATCLEGDDSSF